jgi:hypothetical protein
MGDVPLFPSTSLRTNKVRKILGEEERRKEGEEERHVCVCVCVCVCVGKKGIFVVFYV